MLKKADLATGWLSQIC